jgi:hypothetical protein
VLLVEGVHMLGGVFWSDGREGKSPHVHVLYNEIVVLALHRLRAMSETRTWRCGELGLCALFLLAWFQHVSILYQSEQFLPEVSP